MNCEEARKKLSWYLDSELDDAEHRAVAQHLDSCSECNRIFDEYKQDERHLIDALSGVRAPAGFHVEIPVEDDPWKKKTPRLKMLGYAAAAVFIVAGGSLSYVNTRTAGPLDVQVLGSTTLHADSLASLRFFLMDHEKNSPVRGAKLTLSIGSHNLGTFESDDKGTVQGSFKVPDMDSGDYKLEVKVASLSGNETLRRTVRVTRQFRILLNTDKPIYRPGQELLMRALTVNNFTLKPHEKGEGTFRVFDSKNNRIFRRKVPISEFGIASTRLQLADELNLGTYRVEFQAGELHQSRTVEVSRYVLPKFKVSIDLDRTYYHPGDLITGRVSAAYTFGKDVDGVVRIEVFDSAGRPKAVIARHRLGTFEIGPVEAEGNVTVVAGVTDTADHMEKAQRTAPFDKQPLKLTVIPDGGRVVSGVPNDFYVITTYPDGRAAKCDVSFDQKGKLIEARTDGLGVAKITVDDPFRFDLVEARDDTGLVLRELKFDYSRVKKDHLALRLDRTMHQAGAPLTATILSSMGDGTYFLDLLKGGQILATRTVEVKNGRADETFDMPVDVQGTVVLAAYKFQKNKLRGPTYRATYVSPPGELHIRPRLSKEAYLPGQEITIDFDVVDQDGKPVPSALGVQIVDEAVYALIESRGAIDRLLLSVEENALSSPHLTAAATEIYGRDNPNAQSLAASEVEGVSVSGVMSNDYPGRVASVRGFIKKFNRRASITLFAAAFTIAILLIAILFGQAITRFFRSLKKLGWGEVFGLAVIVSVVAILGTSTIGTRYLSEDMAVGKAVPMANDAGFETDAKHDTPDSEDGGGIPVRVRQYFPETLHWEPQLITDDNGRVSIKVPGADSITTWRMLTSAVTRDGRMGHSVEGIRVFQDFFVDIDFPVALTKGDTIHVPVAVYNYLKEDQAVTVTMETADWFEALDETEKRVNMKAGEVGVVYFGLRVKKHGKKELTVRARSSKGLADAIRRQVEIMEHGKQVTISISDRLKGEVKKPLAIPVEAIDGSTVVYVRLMPGAGGDLAGGLEGMIHMPDG